MSVLHYSYSLPRQELTAVLGVVYALLGEYDWLGV